VAAGGGELAVGEGGGERPAAVRMTARRCRSALVAAWPKLRLIRLVKATSASPPVR